MSGSSHTNPTKEVLRAQLLRRDLPYHCRRRCRPPISPLGSSHTNPTKEVLRAQGLALVPFLSKFSSIKMVGTYGSCGGRPSIRQEEKWWLPCPKVPQDGLSEDARKSLQQCRDCANQILKAALAINGSVLPEMEIPSAYLDTLPKAD
nr:rop guanine nucleotide exchange factor 1 [Quercus suber]